MLVYTDELTNKYRQLVALPGFILLESIDKTRGRYDILSAYPYESICWRKKEDVSSIFDDLQAKIPPAQVADDLPFQGGFLGLFTYDLAEKLANLAPGLPTSLPFVAGGLYDWAIVVDHALKSIRIFSGGQKSETAAIIQEVVDLWNRELVSAQEITRLGHLKPLITHKAYQHAFHAIHRELYCGRCYQVNFTQPFELPYRGHPWAVYEAIKRVNPVPYAAFMTVDEVAILSFSPERLLQMDEKFLLASPIKGSARRDTDRKKDDALKQALSACAKNRAENVMIVDLLRNDLGRFAVPGSIDVPYLCHLESYEGVHHLVSHITAIAKDTIMPLTAMSHCFPGASITGAPKLESMRVITEHEPYRRGAYCGSMGYISSHGRMDMNIAIRTLTLTPDTMHFSAGGGIVMDSLCEQEYDECFIKIAGILKGLPI